MKITLSICKSLLATTAPPSSIAALPENLTFSRFKVPAANSAPPFPLAFESAIITFLKSIFWFSALTAPPFRTLAPFAILKPVKLRGERPSTSICNFSPRFINGKSFSDFKSQISALFPFNSKPTFQGTIPSLKSFAAFHVPPAILISRPVVFAISRAFAKSPIAVALVDPSHPSLQEVCGFQNTR